MGEKADHEEECQMMSIPKGFEALLTDLLMGRGVHQHHDEEHKMPGNAASLCVVYIKRRLGANLCEQRVSI